MATSGQLAQYQKRHHDSGSNSVKESETEVLHQPQRNLHTSLCRPLSPCSHTSLRHRIVKRIRCSPSRQQDLQEHPWVPGHTPVPAVEKTSAVSPSQHTGSSAARSHCSAKHLPRYQESAALTNLETTVNLPGRPALSLETAGLMASGDVAASAAAFPRSASPRKATTRPPPLLLPSSASALSSPSSLSLASPVSPSFTSSRKARNAKQLSLAVPSITTNSNSSPLSLTASRFRVSASQRSCGGPPSVPLSPNASGDCDAADLSETRSCPPTPRVALDTDNAEDVILEASNRGELKSSLRGDISMRRRTSLPRLKILPSKIGAGRDNPTPSTPLFARPKNSVPALMVESLVARNKEAGAPLVESGEAEEDFPYQLGPKEILPGLFLGSEQNAKDPAILTRLGITHVICCAKEVSCPWLNDVGPLDVSQTIAMNDAGADGQDRAPTPLDSDGRVNSMDVPASLALPSRSLQSVSASSGHEVSYSSSPSRPVFLRPAVSTPNLKEKSRGSTYFTLRQEGSPLELSNSTLQTTFPRVAPGHSGYLHRQVPADHSTGRPALLYTKLPWGHDEEDVAKHFETYQICELIDKARQDGGQCLVHCQLGVSRSATLMIGYCMRQAFSKQDAGLLENVKSMHDSYTFVRAKSRWVAPNIGLLAQLVQYERALAAENVPDQSIPYSNSAYYDSQLSLSYQQGSRTPDNLSTFSASDSDVDSRLTTPDTVSDVVGAASTPEDNAQKAGTPRLNKAKGMPVEGDACRLSPMTAALRLARPTEQYTRQVLERAAFGSIERKREHRKTFSADFSKFPLAFTQHHDGP